MHQCITNCPATPSPDGLLVNLATEPTLIGALSGYVNAATILDMAMKRLIDFPDDASIRSEDPQGALTKFGEGIVFVEALVAQCKVS